MINELYSISWNLSFKRPQVISYLIAIFLFYDVLNFFLKT